MARAAGDRGLGGHSVAPPTNPPGRPRARGAGSGITKIADDRFAICRNEAVFAETARDGIYVIRTNLPADP